MAVDILPRKDGYNAYFLNWTEKRVLDFPLVSEEIAVVILARDEAQVLEETLSALEQSIGTLDVVHVVADHCQDGTATVARQAGAAVHTRTNGRPAGKGQALRWWLKRTHRGASPDQTVIVLDADSLIAPNFLECIQARLRDGDLVVQARLEPQLRSQSPVVRLAAYSEIVEHRVSDASRARLGWPVRLRGTGMAFRRWVLEEVADSLHTLVEDAELTLLLGAKGFPIAFAEETYVTDPKPDDDAGAVRQRARWLKGQFQVLFDYPGPILRLLARGVPGWSLLSSVLLKPKTLLIPLKAILVAAMWLANAAWGGFGWAMLACLGTATLLFDASVYLIGLKYVPDRRATMKLLALSPLFFGLWLRSLALSMVTGNRWLRTRPRGIEEQAVEPVRVS